HASPMLVEDHEPRLVHQRVIRANDAVEDVEVPTARNGRAGVERFVESADRLEHVLPKRHVRARTEIARASGIQRIAGEVRAVADAREPAAEAAALLEYDLRLRFELHLQDLAGEG